MQWNVFQDFNATNLSIFFYKTCIFFQFFTLIVIIQVFQPNRKSPLGFDSKLLENVFQSLVSFQILLSESLQFFSETWSFFEISCHFFRFL